jgi:hypothetical protein
MAYGHAERNLALIRLLEGETWQLLTGLSQPDPEQSAWLQEIISRRQAGGKPDPGADGTEARRGGSS